nr:uncharacterized protein LOC113809235 [Penaeus vannamei]
MTRRKLESGAKADVEEAVFEWLLQEVRCGPRAGGHGGGRARAGAPAPARQRRLPREHGLAGALQAALQHPRLPPGRGGRLAPHRAARGARRRAGRSGGKRRGRPPPHAPGGEGARGGRAAVQGARAGPPGARAGGRVVAAAAARQDGAGAARRVRLRRHARLRRRPVARDAAQPAAAGEPGGGPRRPGHPARGGDPFGGRGGRAARQGAGVGGRAARHHAAGALRHEAAADEGRPQLPREGVALTAVVAASRSRVTPRAREAPEGPAGCLAPLARQTISIT